MIKNVVYHFVIPCFIFELYTILYDCLMTSFCLQKVCRLLLFSEFASFGSKGFYLRSLPFSDDFADFRCPKNMRGFYDKVEMRRPKFIVAVVKILCSSRKFC